MKYEFSPPRLEKQYTDEKNLIKKYGNKISEGIFKFLGAVEVAENAYDLKCIPFFYMEHKKGNLKEYYSISVDKKRSKWRLLIQMLDDNDNVVTPSDNEKEFLKSIKKIRIKEMSEHYDEY